MTARPSPNIVWVPVDVGRKASYQAETLRILFLEESGVLSVHTLCYLTRYSNITIFKRSVLQRLHDKQFVNYDKSASTVTLTRLGWLVARHSKL